VATTKKTSLLKGLENADHGTLIWIVVYLRSYSSIIKNTFLQGNHTCRKQIMSCSATEAECKLELWDNDPQA
jgi:hypothetical protein